MVDNPAISRFAPANIKRQPHYSCIHAPIHTAPRTTRKKTALSDVLCIQKVSFDDKGKSVTGCGVLAVRSDAGLRLRYS